MLVAIDQLENTIFLLISNFIKISQMTQELQKCFKIKLSINIFNLLRHFLEIEPLISRLYLQSNHCAL